MAGCSSKITQEQLTQLTTLRQQETSLKSQQASLQTRQAEVQRELSARRADLDRCNENMRIVNQRLAPGQWPNIWPDWPDTAVSSQSGTRR